MKLTAISGYTFNPTANTLDLSGIVGCTPANLLAVLNTTAGALVYAVGTVGLGATHAGNVLTLQTSLDGMSSGDALTVIFDDGSAGARDTSLQTILAKLPTLNSGRVPVEIDAGSVAVQFPAWLAQDSSLQTLISDVGSNHADLQAIHTDTGSTLHADLQALLAKLPASPALDATVAAITTLLTARLPALAAGRTPVDGSGVTQPISATALPLPAGAMADTTGQLILTALQAQRAESLWTDDTNAFFVRVDNRGTISWTDPSGNALAGPGAGARPAAGTSAIVDASRYQANKSGTGYSNNDYLSHVVTTDPASGTVIGHFWLNVTTETKLSAGPPTSDIAPIAPLPANASNAPLQTAGNTILQAIQSLLGKGQQNSAGSLSVVLSSDGPFATNFGLQADAAATSDAGAFSFVALFKRALGYLGTLAGTTTNGSVKVTPASVDAAFIVDGTINAATGLSSILQFTPPAGRDFYFTIEGTFTGSILLQKRSPYTGNFLSPTIFGQALSIFTGSGPVNSNANATPAYCETGRTDRVGDQFQLAASSNFSGSVTCTVWA